MKPIKCLLTILAACASLGLASQANALVIGDTHELGFVNFGIPSGDQDRENYVNHLIGMALGSSDTFSGQDFKRSNHNFGPLADAIFDHNGTSNTGIDVTGFDYLFAKYDGPNYGSEVWYVGDLSGVITIPATASRYGLSSWTLFTGSGANVPDTGATASLLGAALMGLALLRARLQKA
jgi:hypothetical protein